MLILIVSPLRENLASGNRVTAERWREILASLGHSVDITAEYRGQICDAMIALHAIKSSSAMIDFKEKFPNLPLILALTGTDLYGEGREEELENSLGLADRIVVLQKMAIEKLSDCFQSKARVIYQSSYCSDNAAEKAPRFQVCTLGHLRPVKDPLRTAYAVRELPPRSKIRVVHAGRALDSGSARQALRETESNSRYRWIGEVEHSRALEILASSHLLSLTSKVEGGANVLSEALACDVPVVASRIPGLVGTLGKDYDGFFPLGDTEALKELLLRAEGDAGFYGRLVNQCREAAKLISPERERRSWESLLEELSGK